MSIATWWKGYHGDVRTALLRLTDVQADPKTAVTVRDSGRVFDEAIGGWLVTVMVRADHVDVWFGLASDARWQSLCVSWHPNATGALGLEWLFDELNAAESMTRRHTGCDSQLLSAMASEVRAARAALEVAQDSGTR